MIHAADVVVPVATAPIDGGAVLVEDGRIVELGALEQLVRRHPEREVAHWDGVMTPGLVNAHTHLQFTGFDRVGAVAYPDYVAWAMAFVAEYDARPDEDWVAAARAGVELSLAAGVTCIADVVTDWTVRDVLFETATPGVAYLELIGTDWDEWVEGVAEALEAALTGAPRAEWFGVGVSPHAPYSVDERVIEQMIAMARGVGARVHSHVAEIESEDELYLTGTGPWAQRVRDVARRRHTIAHRGGVGMGTAEFTSSLGLFAPDCHIAHGIYLDPAGRAAMKRAGTIAALCPRSNLTLAQSPPPIAAYLEESVPFAIGTDSLGSVQSLDLMADVALLRRLAVEHGYDQPDLDRRLLEAATLTGARALGMETVLGSIEPGKRADLSVFSVDTDASGAERAMVTGGAGHCTDVVVGGVPRSR